MESDEVVGDEDRRQLTREQRLPIVKALREEGHSQRAISEALKVPKSTIGDDVKLLRNGEVQLSGAGQLKPSEQITGLDGVARPSKRRSPAEVKKRRVEAAGRVAVGCRRYRVSARLCVLLLLQGLRGPLERAAF